MNLPAAHAVAPTKIMTGDEARAYAKELAESTMISPYFRGSIANMMYAIELGNVYGLQAATVLQNIHVFDGKDGSLKAGISASLMATLGRRAGHIVSVSANHAKATATLVRGDSLFGKMLKGDVSPEELAHYSTILATLKDMGVDPKQLAFSEVLWNEEKAITAGLFGKKGPWTQYPQSMYAAAAKRDVIRLGADEVLIQLADTAQSLGEFRALDGRAINVNYRRTADEIAIIDGEDFSLTDEGVVVPDSDARSGNARTYAAPAPRPAQAPQQPRPQEQPAAPAPEPPEVNDRVRDFVQDSEPKQVADWVTKTAVNEELDPQVRDKQIDIVLSLVGGIEDVTKTADVVEAISSVASWDNAAKLTNAVALLSPATAQHVMDVMTVIANTQGPTNEAKLTHINLVYGSMKKLGRTTEEVTFGEFTGPLEKSLKRCVQPLIQP